MAGAARLARTGRASLLRCASRLDGKYHGGHGWPARLVF